MVDFMALLIDALRHLAMSPDDQMSYLAQIGNGSVDELALEFGDVASMADARLKQGEISKAQHDKIVVLDAVLDRMSGRENAALWTADALRSSEEWEGVRRLAHECLRSLRVV